MLLQAHFSRVPLSGDLREDQKGVLETSTRLLQVPHPVTTAAASLLDAQRPLLGA